MSRAFFVCPADEAALYGSSSPTGPTFRGIPASKTFLRMVLRAAGDRRDHHEVVRIRLTVTGSADEPCCSCCYAWGGLRWHGVGARLRPRWWAPAAPRWAVRPGSAGADTALTIGPPSKSSGFLPLRYGLLSARPADPGLVKRRHAVVASGRRLEHRESEGCAGGFTQAHTKVEQRALTDPLDQPAMARLG